MRAVPLMLILAAATPARAARPAFPTLDEDDRARLAAGKLVLLRDVESEQAGTVTGVMRIHAPPERIWDVLLDFEAVPEHNSSMEVAQDYTAEMDRTPPPGARFIDIHWELSAVGQTVRYNIHHTYHPDQGYLEWTLDGERGNNEIEATEGSWSLWPVEGQSDAVDFLYVTRVDTGRSVPSWVEALLTRTSLTRYITWVKETAEAG